MAENNNIRFLSRFGTYTILFVIILFIIAVVFFVFQRGTIANKRNEIAGDINRINQEATVIFERFGAKEVKFLYESDLKDFPLISSLGNSVGLYPKTPKFPEHIEIRYGSHSQTKFIFIFNPNKTVELNNTSSFVQVSSNIFKLL